LSDGQKNLAQPSFLKNKTMLTHCVVVFLVIRSMCLPETLFSRTLKKPYSGLLGYSFFGIKTHEF